MPTETEGQGNRTPLSLAQAEREWTVDDEIALGELRLRIDTAKRIIKLFTVSNGFILAFLVVLLIADWVLVGKGLAAAGERIVTENVLMALLGATTVQVGTIMFGISAYLFPRKEGGG